MSVEKLTQTNYVDVAENMIKSLREKDRRGNTVIRFTTSKLRNILSMVNNVYNEAIHSNSPVLDEKLQSRVQYLRMRIAYEAGRETIVGDFVKKSGLLEHLKRVGDSKQELLLFCHYVEALVAYRRYYGKDE